MSQVWRLDVDHTRRIILLALSDHADDDGNNIYPSIGYLAWKTGMSERTVQYTLRDLENQGCLTIVHKATQHHPRVYRLDLSALSRKPPYQRSDQSGVQNLHPSEDSRGAKSAPLNNPGVQTTTSRGAIAIAPKPSWNRPIHADPAISGPVLGPGHGPPGEKSPPARPCPALNKNSLARAAGEPGHAPGPPALHGPVLSQEHFADTHVSARDQKSLLTPRGSQKRTKAKNAMNGKRKTAKTASKTEEPGGPDLHDSRARSDATIRRGALWTAICAACHIESATLTASERGDLGRTVKELLALPTDSVVVPDAETIAAFRPWWTRAYPRAKLTHRCYRLHWGQFVTAHARANPPPISYDESAYPDPPTFQRQCRKCHRGFVRCQCETKDFEMVRMYDEPYVLPATPARA